MLAGQHVPLPRASLSQLRYPGSKRKLLPAIRTLVASQPARVELLVEPFCGGASIALGLLAGDAVDRVILGDADELVGAFWQAATCHTGELVEAMRAEPVTLQRWDYWRSAQPDTLLGRALKCLFLNRTSFSGIIGGNAGPIGGRSQGSYRIDCRFDKDTVATRLETIGRLRRDGRIAACHTAEWQDTLRLADAFAAAGNVDGANIVYYLDPPYVRKAGRLYEQSFTMAQHQHLAEALAARRGWILSYDAEPPILNLYRGQPGVREYQVAHHYTMTGRRARHAGGREVVFARLGDPAG